MSGLSLPKNVGDSILFMAEDPDTRERRWHKQISLKPTASFEKARLYKSKTSKNKRKERRRRKTRGWAQPVEEGPQNARRIKKH